MLESFIFVLGYCIRISSITCISEIQERADRVSTEELCKTSFYFFVFFDGNRMEWTFKNKEEAEKIRQTIIDKIEYSLLEK
jgi:hypothetical protein